MVRGPYNVKLIHGRLVAPVNLKKYEIAISHLKNSVPTSERTHYSSVIKVNNLITLGN
jgi:hypothetical protein